MEQSTYRKRKFLDEFSKAQEKSKFKKRSLLYTRKNIISDYDLIEEKHNKELKTFYKSVTNRPLSNKLKRLTKNYFKSLKNHLSNLNESKINDNQALHPFEREERRRNYGRWYLHPSKFARRLK